MFTQGNITYEWQCSICKRWHTEQHGLLPHSEPFQPADLPKGWTEVRSTKICPRHQVVAMVDGAMLPEDQILPGTTI